MQNFAGFFDKNEKAMWSQIQIYSDAFGKFSVYLKEYTNNVRSKIGERNYVSSEYYKSKIFINEKKNKTIMMDPSSWGITREQCA